MTKQCYLAGYGECHGPISREHYISKNILEFGAAGSKAAEIGGLRWQPPSTLQRIGISSLVAPVLCTQHNASLKEMDSQAGRLIRILNAIDKDPRSVAPVNYVNGLSFERWILKVVCGLSAAGHLNNGLVPSAWKEILVGGEWPSSWGVYFPIASEPTISTGDLCWETKIDPKTGELKAVVMYFAGLHVNLCLGVPKRDYSGNSCWGIRRPARLNFVNGVSSKIIDLMWPEDSREEINYVHVGGTHSRPPHDSRFEKPDIKPD